MRKIAQFGKYIRSLAIPPWTSFTVYVICYFVFEGVLAEFFPSSLFYIKQMVLDTSKLSRGEDLVLSR
jgi:hypothetical protein